MTLHDVAPDAGRPRPDRPEAALLADALDVDAALLRPTSREPLGDGVVAGFALTDPGVGELVHYIDTSRLPVRAETGLVAGDDPEHPDVRVWLHPADPHLPALGPAAFGGAVRALLERAGIEGSAAAEMIAYRPGRRAVLRAATADGHAWIKVVRPDRVDRLVRTHIRFEEAGLPVPRVRAWSADGLLVVDQAEGAPATDVVWEPSDLLDEVEALRERMSGLDLAEPVRGVGRRLAWYRDRLVAPGEESGERAHAVADHARAVLLAHPRGEGGVGVHGDLHYGQLFLGDRLELVGLIDLDTAGVGEPAEDAAAFHAHAIASALLTPPGEGRDRVQRLAGAAAERWGGDPRERALTAVHLLGHALGAVDADDADRAGALLAAAAGVLEGVGARSGD